MSKVWFVTGANSGIGEGAVRAALDAGDQVVATGRNIEKLRAAFADVQGDDLALIALDVTDEAQAQTAIAEAVARFGRIDVVVNSAGFGLLGNFEDLSAADFQRQFDTNFFGVVHVLHAALPVMRAQRSGHVFNISSVAGGVGMNNCSAYSASKFALEGLSQAIGAEVEQFGIKMTVVEPGFFRTQFLNQDNAVVVETTVADYAGAGSAREAYAAYDGVQPGNPRALGRVLVDIVSMTEPMKLFLAGSDAVAMLTPVAEERLRAIGANAELSGSTDGGF